MKRLYLNVNNKNYFRVMLLRFFPVVARLQREGGVVGLEGCSWATGEDVGNVLEKERNGSYGERVY